MKPAISRSNCYFYHWFDLPSGETIEGSWDLRKSWRDYLGHFDFKGKTVFEAGPASGFLSLKMESMGADVTVFDLPPGQSPEILPYHGIDIETVTKDTARSIDRVRNSWNYTRDIFGSKNTAMYGNIYELDRGNKFDVSLLGAILLHLSDPFKAIRSVAEITSETLIVTDLYSEHTIFSPHPETKNPMCWWMLSPDHVAKMLDAVGFKPEKPTFHQQTHYPTLDAKRSVSHKFFTIVAHRK